MKRSIFLFLLFFLIISVVYSPVLYFDYLFHDDGSFFVKLKEYGFKHIFFDSCVSQCRYGDALLLSLENIFVHKVLDLKFLRFLGIVISSCSAYLLLQQMRRLSFSDIRAFLVISSMFFFPGLAVIIFYGISSAMFTLSLFLACWSFHRIETRKEVVIPTFFFLFAITIYPPFAMFYWVMIGMFILFVRDRYNAQFRENIFRFLSVGLTGLLIYAISVFFMHYFFSNKITNSLYNPYLINLDWFSKLQWFFQEPMENALNLWNIFPKMTTSIIVSGFIVVTALIVITKKFIKTDLPKRKEIALTYLWQLCLFIVVFFMTFFPNLVAKENAAFYRCLFPLTSLIWLVLVWAILKWMDIIPKILTKRSLTTLLSIIVVFAGIMTFHNVLYYRVLPSYIEWNAYKLMAEEIHLEKVGAIHIILPYHNLSKERYDEFGVLTSHYNFDIYKLVCCSLNEADNLGQLFPLLLFSYPNDSMLIEINEIFIKRLSNGKWVFKALNKRDNEFHEYNQTEKTLDRGVLYQFLPQPISFKKQNYYVLNLNNLFSSLNYNDTAIEASSDLAEDYIKRGGIYNRLGNFTQAISDYTKAIAINPEGIGGYIYRGIDYAQQGDFIQALSDENKVIELNPNFPEEYYNRAVIYFGLKEYGRAWGDIHKVEEFGYVVNPGFLSALEKASGKDN